MKDVHGWIQPFRQPLIAVLRLIEILNLLLKHGDYAARRIARFEPVSEWVLEEILLRAFLVRFQGIIEDLLEACRRGGSSASVRHKGGRGELRGG